jgi:hypothetical protein
MLTIVGTVKAAARPVNWNGVMTGLLIEPSSLRKQGPITTGVSF